MFPFLSFEHLIPSNNLQVKRNNPSAVTSLQWDKLYVDGRCYAWSDQQGRVVEWRPGEEAGDLGFHAARQWDTSSSVQHSVVCE